MGEVRDMLMTWINVKKLSDDIALVNDRYLVYKNNEVVFDRKYGDLVAIREFRGKKYVYIRDTKRNKPRNLLYAKLLLKCFSEERLKRNVVYNDGNSMNVKFENLIGATTKQRAFDNPLKLKHEGKWLNRWRDTPYYCSKDAVYVNTLCSGLNKIYSRVSALTENESVNLILDGVNTTKSVEIMCYEAKHKVEIEALHKGKPVTKEEMSGIARSMVNTAKVWETRRRRYGKSGGNVLSIDDVDRKRIADDIREGMTIGDYLGKYDYSKSTYYKIKKECQE